LTVAFAGHPVEPIAPRGRGRGRSEPRVATAEAEPDREDRLTPSLRSSPPRQRCRPGSQRRSSGRRAPYRRSRRRAWRRRRFVRNSPARAPRCALCKPQRKLLVEAVEAAHVGENHHPGTRRLIRQRRERGEAVTVGGFEHQIAWETEAPEITAIGGSESLSKHIALIVDQGQEPRWNDLEELLELKAAAIFPLILSLRLM